MKKTFFAFLSAAILAAAIFSCKSTSHEGVAKKKALENIFSTWTLKSVKTESGLEAVKTSATMSLEKNLAAIYTGINRARLAVEISDGKKIAFSDGPMTKMSGPPEDMKIESLFLQNIFKADRYEISDSGAKLFLYAEDAVLLEFSLLEE